MVFVFPTEIVFSVPAVAALLGSLTPFFILKAREEEMTAKVMDLQTQLEELQKKYQQKQEENPGNDKVRGTGLCVTFLESIVISIIYRQFPFHCL